MSTLGVDAVVVEYHTPDDLRGFLESWDACAGDRDRLSVALVDPSPESLRVADGFYGGIHNLLTFDANVGYARACNEAAGHLRCDEADGFEPRGDVTALFNADTRLTPGILQRCADRLRAEPTWAVGGPRQVNDVGQLTHAGITGTHNQCAPRAWLRQDSDLALHQVEKVISVSGSAYFIKTAVWDELADCATYMEWLAANGFNGDHSIGEHGAFLPTDLYFEETWCSYHAAAHGYDIIYLGPEMMVHRWHRSVLAAGPEPTAKFYASHELFRSACDAHGLQHD